MATSSWFITATEARNNIIKDIAVHAEITGIESQILQAVKRGDYEVSITDDTLMTESSPAMSYSFTVDAETSELIIPSHPFQTGDVVQIKSTDETPPPLKANTYYYAIYISTNTIKLAASKNDAISGRPISINIQEGVTQIQVSDGGSGYLLAPTVTLPGGTPTVVAQATSYLKSFGSVYSASLLTTGGNFTDIPTVTVDPVGANCVLGSATFNVVSATVYFGGSNYNVNDLIYGFDGQGAKFAARVTAVNGGTITSVIIQDPGNYTVIPTLVGGITVTNGSGNGASLIISMGIASISISNVGNNYLVPPLVVINGGGGAGATATSYVTGGAVTNIIITNNGSGFTNQPSLSVISGSGATAVARLIPTSVSTISIITNATYSSNPTISIDTVGNGATVQYVYMKTVSVDLVNAGIGYKQGDNLLVSGGQCTQATEIQVLTVNTNGNILTFNIINNGNYIALPSLTSNNVQGGSGVGASFNLVTGVAELSLGNGGSGYTTPPLVIITGDGAEAAAYGTISGGVVTGYVVTNSGSGYTTIPTVSVSGGTGATAVATLVPTTLDHISITNPGSGYITIPLVTISGGGGYGAQATAIIYNGSVTGFNWISYGQNYTDAPMVTIEGNATAEAYLTPTQISYVTVTNQGSNYTHVPTVSISGGAVLQAVMAPTGILSVDITSVGSNYTSDPILNWIAGANQVATPTYPVTKVNRSFGVAGVNIVSPGSNYQNVPDVVFSSPTSSGSLAIATATLGSGIGSFSIAIYDSSLDYFKVWKNQTPSNSLLVRPMTDQMTSVITYFTGLGYNITQFTNNTTLNTMCWSIKW